MLSHCHAVTVRASLQGENGGKMFEMSCAVLSVVCVSWLMFETMMLAKAGFMKLARCQVEPAITLTLMCLFLFEVCSTKAPVS